MPPRRCEISDSSAERTMPGKRDRKPDGRFEPGDLILGRYKILSELGQGGMGVVYKCFDETGGIEVALKVMPPELSHNTLEMEDIRDNFQLVAKLVHQNIAISKQLERDNSNGNYYLIMECVEGENLRQWIKQKRRENALTLETVLPVVRQVAEALDYAHKQKIIHRDIKPGNIMIDSAGHVKVLDFGLAAQIHTSMTRISMAYHGTSGTGPYMAPEQWEGRVQGAAADQYALGVMTYEMLAGHLPFESTEAAVLREAVLKSRAVPVEGLPKYVQTALDRVLSKDPSERFGSCSDFTAALAGIKVGEIKRKSGKRNFGLKLALIIFSGIILLAALVFSSECFGMTRFSSDFSDDGKVLKRVPHWVVRYSIPDGVTSIANFAFSHCRSLTSVTIPSSVTNIGIYAFSDCKSLTSITIPSSVTSIEIGAFDHCSSLTSIRIPDGVTTISANAFSFCDSLTSVTIPPSVTSIGDYAFAVCSSLTSIRIPDGVTSIGDCAFAACKSLKSLTFPSSVISIGVNAFGGAGCEAQVKRDYPHLFSSRLKK